jgi:hypothetical protein
MQVLHTLKGYIYCVHSVAFLADSNLLALALGDATVQV